MKTWLLPSSPTRRTSYASRSVSGPIPGEPNGIPGTVSPTISGRSVQKAADVCGGDVPFDGVVIDRRRVAGGKFFRNAALALVRREFFDAALLEAYIETILAKVSDPGIAARTAGVLDHMNASIRFCKYWRGGDGQEDRTGGQNGAARHVHQMYLMSKVVADDTAEQLLWRVKSWFLPEQSPKNYSSCASLAWTSRTP